MKNFETKNKKELEWTKEKYKLVELIADIPSDADGTFKYLYTFISLGMLEGMFCMSCGHQEELEKLQKEYDERKKLKDAEEITKKSAISIEEKRMNEYVCEIIRLATEIRKLNREEILRCMLTEINDIAVENGIR